MKKIKEWMRLFWCLLLCLCLAGCGANAHDGEAADADAGLTDRMELPDDGIISKEILESIAGKDRTLTVTGKSGDISYTWEISGKNIHNATDMNLSVAFITEEKELADIRKEAGDPPYAIGLVLNAPELVCIPVLTLELPDKWEADMGLLCKEVEGQAARMGDVEISFKDSDKKEHTLLAMSITEAKDVYYVLAGRSAADTSQTAGKEEKTAGNKKKDQDQSAEKKTDKTDSNSAKNTDSKKNSSAKGSGQEPDRTDDNSDEDGDEIYTRSEGDDESDQTRQTSDGTVGADDAEDVGEEDSGPVCTFSIRCDTILDHMEDLTEGKEEFVPSDGWIFYPSEIAFKEGDSVFDLLQSVCREYGIHMEHSYTPGYGSEYIEGINQLYEFDCGPMSGWMYCINGWTPNYGCDQYLIQNGDVIEWVFTCELGKDM